MQGHLKHGKDLSEKHCSTKHICCGNTSEKEEADVPSGVWKADIFGAKQKPSYKLE